MKKNKLLLIGWDAADWKTINPLMDQGIMPNLNKLVNEGTMGNLATLDPPLSPMLWTSIATGKRPYKHGILGFTEPRPDGSGVQPVLNTSRKCKAIWNILTQKELKTHVVGWWPSHPAEPVNGVYISNFYQKANIPKEGEKLDQWPMMKGTIHPISESEKIAKLRVHPWELTEAHLQPFIPDGAKLDQNDKRHRKLISSVRKIIADCSSVHSAATYILDKKEWDFCAVYYDAIDHFGHGFMKFHPPKMEHIPEDLFEGYKNVVTAGYRYHDMMLGKLLSYVDDDTTVLLISDHGFHSNHLRPKGLPKIPAAPALEHSPYGIFMIKGPNIKKDNLIHGASLIDITPTLLNFFDLPIGEDMDGRILEEIFVSPNQIEPIESWEQVEGECGMHSPDILKDSFINQEALDQLVELGYIDKPDEDGSKAVKKTINESQFWLAKSYIDGDLHDQAMPILEELYEANPDHERYGFLLVNTYRKLRKPKEAEKLLAKIRATSKLEGPNILILEAKGLLAQNKNDLALEKLLEAEVKIQNSPALYLHLAQAHMKLKDWMKAESCYKKVIKIDFQNEKAYAGLGNAYLNQRMYEEAAQNFVESIALMYNQPMIHYYLGECLNALGDSKGAARAYEVTLKLNENAQNARQKLSETYEYKLDDKSKALENEEEFLKRLEKEIIIVSGLPRSGTSLMMQMLENGGLPVFTDKKRLPDESNPKGYYEHEAIKGIIKDKRIFQEIKGEVVKVIAQLLLHLPLRYKYKIIFMKRDIDEVIQSQSKMLTREEDKGNRVNASRKRNMLKQSFEKAIYKVEAWSDKMPNVEILYVNHADCLFKTEDVADEVINFLDVSLDKGEMIKAVDGSLYREKTEV